MTDLLFLCESCNRVDGVEVSAKAIAAVIAEWVIDGDYVDVDDFPEGDPQREDYDYYPHYRPYRCRDCMQVELGRRCFSYEYNPALHAVINPPLFWP